MENQKPTSLLKDSRTNWGYVLIIVALGVITGGGILSYYWSFMAQ